MTLSTEKLMMFFVLFVSEKLSDSYLAVSLITQALQPQNYRFSLFFFALI